MIVSHRHKFIFLKTRKTGSTSVELALSEFCGPDDILTLLPPEDEQTRRELGFATAQHYAKTWREYTAKDWLRVLAGRTPVKYGEHMEALRVRRLLGERTWQSYFKFAVERNPWDKAISQYYWRARRMRDSLTLRDFLVRSEPAFSITNFDIYAMDGDLVVDHLIRYEDLDAGLARAGEEIGLPEPLSMPGVRAKGNVRVDRRPYRELLDEEERALIARACRREIDLLNYAY